jgi:hypothetical protein
MLLTKPAPTGSTTWANTIGTVLVACCKDAPGATELKWFKPGYRTRFS